MKIHDSNKNLNRVLYDFLLKPWNEMKGILLIPGLNGLFDKTTSKGREGSQQQRLGKEQEKMEAFGRETDYFSGENRLFH